MVIKIPKIRTKYEESTGKKAQTKAGAHTADYKDYLDTNCKTPWLSTWSDVVKKNETTPYKNKAALLKDLNAREAELKKAEKCVIGGGGSGSNIKRIAASRRELKSKFEIDNY